MLPLRIGIAGLGRWGPNHLRKFEEIDGATVTAVADLEPQRLRAIAGRFPNIQTHDKAEALVVSPDIDAVVIATPTATHAGLVRLALEAGKHVLCEKPLCVRADDAQSLTLLATETRRLLMVGHVFLYNAGINRVKELLLENTCGSLHYLDFTRTNLGPIRSDVDVIYDLASHDISIANYLLGGVPNRISATTGAFLRDDVPDVAFLHAEYPNGVLAHMHVSWLNPKKVRNMTVVGSRRMLTWDEFGEPGPIQVFDRNVLKEQNPYRDFGEFQLKLRDGDVHIPKVQQEEPLARQAQEFLSAIESGTPPVSDGDFAVDVVRVLEAATASAKSDGGFRELPAKIEVEAAV